MRYCCEAVSCQTSDEPLSQLPPIPLVVHCLPGQSFSVSLCWQSELLHSAYCTSKILRSSGPPGVSRYSRLVLYNIIWVLSLSCSAASITTTTEACTSTLCDSYINYLVLKWGLHISNIWYYYMWLICGDSLGYPSHKRFMFLISSCGPVIVILIVYSNFIQYSKNVSTTGPPVYVQLYLKI